MKFFAQFLSIVFVTVWLYVPLTKYSFFQDDFILFDMANRIKSLQDAFARSETIFWRPVALGYFWVGQRVFGLDPYRFHLVSLSMHIINVLLVWILVSRVLSFKRSDPGVRQGRTLSDSPNDIGWLAGLLFGTSAIHFMSQVWIGEYPIILGLTFWLLTLLAGWSWTQRPTWLKATVVTMLYSFGLLTHELTFLAPLVIMGFVVFIQGFGNAGSFLRRHVFQFLSILAPGLLYLAMRLIVSPVQISGTYAPIGISDAAKSLWWYFLWMFNIPEELKYQSFVPFSIRPEFAASFPGLSWLWRIQLVMIPVLGFAFPWFLTKKGNVIARPFGSESLRSFRLWGVFRLKELDESLRPARNASHSEAGGRGNLHPSEIATTPPWRDLAMTTMISLILSVAGGAILLVALGHQYPFLLSFALVGIAMVLASFSGSLAHLRVGNTVIGAFLFLWIFSSWASLRFSEKSHWTVQEAEMAKRIVQAAKDQFGYFPSESTIIVPLGIDGKHKAAMADQFGMRVMFKEKSLTTHYGTYQGILPSECIDVKDVGACLLDHRIYRIKV